VHTARTLGTAKALLPGNRGHVPGAGPSRGPDRLELWCTGRGDATRQCVSCLPRLLSSVSGVWAGPTAGAACRPGCQLRQGAGSAETGALLMMAFAGASGTRRGGPAAGSPGAGSLMAFARRACCGWSSPPLAHRCIRRTDASGRKNVTSLKTDTLSGRRAVDRVRRGTIGVRLAGGYPRAWHRSADYALRSASGRSAQAHRPQQVPGTAS